jgi:hypothetical protein
MSWYSELLHKAASAQGLLPFRVHEFPRNFISSYTRHLIIWDNPMQWKRGDLFLRRSPVVNTNYEKFN